MSPDAIRAALVSPEGKKWWEWDQELLVRFRAVDGAALFHTLFPIAAASQERGPACTAAWLLYKLRPQCLISCREAITALLPEWDVSIEEVVFYIAEQFGVPTVLSTIEELRAQGIDPTNRLDTVRYWVGVFQERLDYSARHDAV
jgi:hypothetical protein